MRIGRWLAVGILGLFALIFALGALTAGSEGQLAVMLVGAISVFMIGFTAFFWRGPSKFRRCAQFLYGE